MDTTLVDTSRYRNPTRVLTSVLASVEKRTLVWLARRMPARVTSDHLTALALASMIGAGASYALARVTPAGLLLATLCLAVNWFGDSLDGTLARVRGHERPRYGFYVDHVVDAIGAAALLGGLALSGYMAPLVALGVLAAYLLVCVEVFLATHSLGTFTMSYLGIGPTELRILLAAANLAAFTGGAPRIAGQTLPLFDIGGAVGIIGLTAIFLITAVRHTRALYQAEPIPRSGKVAG